MRRVLVAAMVIGIVAIVANVSHAALMLRFESGADVLEVDDAGSPGEVEPPFRSFVGDFEVTFTFGQIIGGGGDPLGIDLHLDVESLAPGVLTVQLTATDLDIGQVTTLSNYLGGFSFPAIAPDAISFTVGFDDGNVPFSLPVFSTIGPVHLGGSSFAALSQSLAVTGSGLFSLTQSIVITANEANQMVVFDSGALVSAAQVGTVPEPGALAVWVGLIGFGACICSRRRRNSAA